MSQPLTPPRFTDPYVGDKKPERRPEPTGKAKTGVYKTGTLKKCKTAFVPTADLVSCSTSILLADKYQSRFSGRQVL